jgi:hypothetical protein
MVETVDVPDVQEGKWAVNAPAVRRCLKWLKRKGQDIDAADVVAWDCAHGKHLFEWDDETAAEEYRLHQARVFLGSFRSVINGMSVKVFRAIPANEAAGVEERTYFSTDTISQRADLRQIVIEDLTKRLLRMGSELKFWKLDETERQVILKALEAEMMLA